MYFKVCLSEERFVSSSMITYERRQEKIVANRDKEKESGVQKHFVVTSFLNRSYNISPIP